MSPRRVGQESAHFGKTWRWIAGVLAEQPDGCWLWPYGCDGHGYPVIRKATGQGNEKVSHVMLRKTGNERPEGAFALHSCDEPLCVNPNHLRWGTALDNSRDMVLRGRWAGKRALKSAGSGSTTPQRKGN